MRAALSMAGILLLLGVTGCSTNPKSPKYARINDVSVPSPLNSGYRVVAVDGTAETRAVGVVHTLVPLVLVEPGTHTITVKPDGEESTADITAMFEAEKVYRIDQDEDGAPILVEFAR